jgi:hypothetical protein
MTCRGWLPSPSFSSTYTHFQTALENHRLSRDKARKICRGSSTISGPKLLPPPPVRPAADPERVVLDNGVFDAVSAVPAAERREEVVEVEDVWIPASRGILFSVVRGCCRSSSANAICSRTWSVYCLTTLSNRDAVYSVSRRLSTCYLQESSNESTIVKRHVNKISSSVAGTKRYRSKKKPHLGL